MSNYMRNWEINIYPITSDSGSAYEFGTMRTINELRVTFNIRNTGLGDPSLAMFEMYNLAPETKAIFETGRAYVEFNAGYNENLHNVFSGEVTNAYELRQECDVIYHLTCRDTMKDIMTYQPVLDTYSSEVTRLSIVNKIVASSPNIKGLKYTGDTENTITNSDSLPDYTCLGTVGEELEELLGAIQIKMYAKNGYIYLVGETDDVKQYDADADPIKVGRDTGLLTRPNIEWAWITWTHLLNAKFYPGVLIELDSDTFTRDLGNEFYVEQEMLNMKMDGIFKIMEVTHKGDTRGNLWDSLVKTEGSI